MAYELILSDINVARGDVGRSVRNRGFPVLLQTYSAPEVLDLENVVDLDHVLAVPVPAPGPHPQPSDVLLQAPGRGRGGGDLEELGNPQERLGDDERLGREDRPQRLEGGDPGAGVHLLGLEVVLELLGRLHAAEQVREVIRRLGLRVLSGPLLQLLPVVDLGIE